MQPTALALLALLAPLPAAAFGDLDCITLESCGNGACGPTTEPIAITFDWAGDGAMVTMFDIDHTLIWLHAGDGDSPMATSIEYADAESMSRTLRINADAAGITAFYTFNAASGAIAYKAVCDVRTDA